ncbi:hypothetical protein [Bacillus mycoides]|uniref:Uncharacterized protein n=1 Tax=Bacillus mycoides TaxID=1405 RepID=A0ABC9QUD8_BACMY|nr:hypothetical protein [Bacillus mycoides]EJR29149.1 hypothetical protein III_05954 [Bacillus mycoides]
MLIRLLLGVILFVLGSFLGDITFFKYVIVGGFLALTAWSIADSQYGSFDRFFTKIYMTVSAIYIVYYFIIPAIKNSFVLDKFGTSSSGTAGPGLILSLILFWLVYSDYQKT